MESSINYVIRRKADGAYLAEYRNTSYGSVEAWGQRDGAAEYSTRKKAVRMLRKLKQAWMHSRQNAPDMFECAAC